ncbi:MAG: ATP-binding protein [Candidatus Firestonebacteria bacterium]
MSDFKWKFSEHLKFVPRLSGVEKNKMEKTTDIQNTIKQLRLSELQMLYIEKVEESRKLMDKTEDLVKLIEEKNNNWNDKLESLRQKESEISSLSERLETKEKIADKFVDEVKSKKDKLEINAEEINRYNKELVSLLVELKGKQYSKEFEQIDKLNKELRLLAEERDIAVTRCEEKTQEVERVRWELQSLAIQFEEREKNWNEKIKMYEPDKEKLEKQNADKGQQIDRLKKELQALIEERNILNTNYEEKIQEVKRLKDELHFLNIRFEEKENNWSENIKLFRQEQVELNRQNADKGQQIDRFNKKLQALAEEKNTVSTKYEEKVKEIDRLNSEFKKTLERFRENEKVGEKNSEELRDKKRELTLKEQEINQLKEKLKILEGKKDVDGKINDTNVQEKTKQIEEMLKVERVVMKELIFGVVHQIRNPLGIISTNTQFLLKKKKYKKGEDKLLQVIFNTVESFNRKIDIFLELANPIELFTQVVSLSKVLDGIFSIVEEKCKMQNIKLIKGYPADLPKAEVDANKLSQALLNIFSNSLFATPEGGTIEVNTHLDFGKKEVAIRFVDNGSGISQVYIDQVGIPFFTTKKDALGLGIFSAKRIIISHKGHIKIDTNSDKGITVTVFLPYC